MIAERSSGEVVRREGGVLATGLLVAGGLALLTSRLLVMGHPLAVPILVSIYVLLGLVFVAAPVANRGEPQLAVPLAAAVGLIGVAVAMAAARPPIPLAHGPEAIWLGSLAAVAEEIFFRRFMYARLVRLGPAVAIGVSAALFALVHVPAYGPAVFWVDLGAGLVLSWQRWASGTWTVPAATHVVANLVAVLR